jgi:polyphosphate kinase 2 (PPK2 family)
MLDKINLRQKLSKAAYKAQIQTLRSQVYDRQQDIKRAGIPVVIIFEGWEAAGKDRAIRNLTRRLDPRSSTLHDITPERTSEKKYPWLWRYWMKLPAAGHIAIFHKSWYRRVLVDRVEGLVSAQDWQRAYRDIVDFERTIADDGCVIIKFWFHISRKEQRKRFKKMKQDTLTAWRVTDEALAEHKDYDDYFIAAEQMLERTYTEWGPWVIVPATDDRFAQVQMFKTIIETLERRLGQNTSTKPQPIATLTEPTVNL